MNWVEEGLNLGAVSHQHQPWVMTLARVVVALRECLLDSFVAWEEFPSWGVLMGLVSFGLDVVVYVELVVFVQNHPKPLE